MFTATLSWASQTRGNDHRACLHASMTEDDTALITATGEPLLITSATRTSNGVACLTLPGVDRLSAFEVDLNRSRVTDEIPRGWDSNTIRCSFRSEISNPRISVQKRVLEVVRRCDCSVLEGGRRRGSAEHDRQQHSESEYQQPERRRRGADRSLAPGFANGQAGVQH